MENSYQWIEDLEKYLNSDEDILEPEEVIETPNCRKQKLHKLFWEWYKMLIFIGVYKATEKWQKTTHNLVAVCESVTWTITAN